MKPGSLAGIDRRARKLVAEAIEKVKDPEIVACINRVCPNFGINHQVKQAKLRLYEWELRARGK